MASFQWINRYRNPLGRAIISQDRPGEKIAAAITEIQDAIDNMTGADGKGDEISGLPAGGTDGQLLQRDSTGAGVWGWGRMKNI